VGGEGLEGPWLVTESGDEWVTCYRVWTKGNSSGGEQEVKNIVRKKPRKIKTITELCEGRDSSINSKEWGLKLKDGSQGRKGKTLRGSFLFKSMSGEQNTRLGRSRQGLERV